MDVISGGPQDVRLGRPRDVRSGRSRDGQIGSLGDVLGTLEEDVLATSWGPIFAGCVDSTVATATFVHDVLLSLNWKVHSVFS